jgi:hypothetical protein
MTPNYEDIDFDAVTNIVELAEIFSTGAYKDQNRGAKQESYAGIIAQHDSHPRSNYENAAQVLYIDRTRMLTEKIVEMKAMWFDEDGNRTTRPIRNPSLDGK